MNSKKDRTLSVKFGGGWSSLVIPSPDNDGDLIVRAAIGHDECPDNPNDWGNGTIYSRSTRHSAYIPDIETLLVKHECPVCGSKEGHLCSDNRTWECYDCPEDACEHEAEPSDAIPLSYFEHGLCKWGVAGTMQGMPDFRWDGVFFAGVWVPGEDQVRHADENIPDGHARTAWFMEAASAACQVYTMYCNGEVYYCAFSVHKVVPLWDEPCHDPAVYTDDPHPLVRDSYGGCYGLDGVIEELAMELREYGVEEVTLAW